MKTVFAVVIHLYSIAPYFVSTSRSGAELYVSERVQKVIDFKVKEYHHLVREAEKECLLRGTDPSQEMGIRGLDGGYHMATLSYLKERSPDSKEVLDAWVYESTSLFSIHEVPFE